MRSFQIELNGHRYTGRWKQEDDSLEVVSDYGKAKVRLEGRDPAIVARERLAAMIPRSWR